jgi:hypothetical protein
MGPEKDEQYQYAECFPQIQAIPQHIDERSLEFPFKKCADRKVNGIPQAYHQISSFPDSGNSIEPPQWLLIMHGRGK